MEAHASHESGRPGRRVTAGASLRFIAATEQLETGQPVVSVMGEVDVASAAALEQTLLDVADDPADEVIVDLSGCSFLDARGLRALLATGERRRQANRRLSIVLSNPNVMRIFQITRFDQRFAIYPTLAAALNRSAPRLA
jgi:anti-sigma B factor antagonist